MQDVIRKAFDAAGIRAGSDVMDYLSQQLGNDRYVTYQELEKLITFAGEAKTLRFEDVQALVDYNREINFDNVVNAVADRNLQALEKTLTLLLREGTQPVAYLRALQRYFNRLYYIKAQMAEGQSAEQVISGPAPAGIFPAGPHPHAPCAKLGASTPSSKRLSYWSPPSWPAKPPTCPPFPPAAAAYCR